jgi:MinD-like ATPase involved in chromosome partitioning or flagellar assembly
VALIAIAADKGGPGVTTAATALAAVWPRPVLLVECDAAGGDLAYRLPADDGGPLNPSRGLLSLGAVARRGLHPQQIHEHTQRLIGGLEVLVGIASAEQAAGLTWLWEPLAGALQALPDVDTVLDCGRIGAHPPINQLLAEADMVLLLTRPKLDQVAHLRERVSLLGAALAERTRTPPPLGVAVVADPKEYGKAIAEVRRVLVSAGLPDLVLGGLAYDVKGAELLRGEWGGRLDRTLLIRSARELAATLAAHLASHTRSAGGTGMEKGAVTG